MEKSDSRKDNFIQANSPEGGFLQSVAWRKFQEAFGRKTFTVAGDNFWANIIEHKLPVVGRYFYIPRGPILEIQSLKLKVQNDSSKFKMDESRNLYIPNINNTIILIFDF